jgi:2,4-dichlorophenol 6-monooxygenase
LKLPGLDIRVRKIGPWDVGGVVAKNYKFGRVFLAGDAAHRHPPVSALGLNTAFGDAHNLAWKLALVVEGKAPETLLQSYESERQPVGARVAEWALNGFRLRSLIDMAIGLAPGQKEANREAFDRLFSDTPGGATARAVLAEAMQIQRVGPQAHDMDIGHAYEKGALVADGTPPPSRDPMAGIYHPSTRPGSRIPHVWLDSPDGRVSTHDLLRPGRFCLFCDAAHWNLAASQVAKRQRIPIDVVTISGEGGYRDNDGEWARKRQVEPGGAVLVRPDGHVAWRSFTSPANPMTALDEAVRTVLGREIAP